MQLLCTHHLPICFLHSQIPHSFYAFDSLVSFLYSTLLFTSPSQISASQDPPSTMKPRPSLQNEISQQNLKKLSCSAMLTLAYQSLGLVYASTRMMRKFMSGTFALFSLHARLSILPNQLDTDETLSSYAVEGSAET
ncbi:unnamed protein product [Camellia sinensis]